MRDKNIFRVLLFGIPLVIWPFVFIIFEKVFLYAMSIATMFLGLTTILYFKSNLTHLLIEHNQRSKLKPIFVGLASAFILYIIFLLGGEASYYLGFGSLVLSIYNMILSVNIVILSSALVIIGIMEEVYWRGFVQGIFINNNVQYPWILSSIYYSIVHVATFNYILVIAALIVGLITGYTAYRFGLISSIIAHVIWLELVIIIFPVLP